MDQASKRLYLFTGKGGVGKTSISIAFCKYLKQKNRKPYYVTFHSSSLKKKQENKQSEIEAFLKNNGLETLQLELEDTLKKYISLKFNSKTIAQFIIKAPFFRSLINIIPGFNYVIFMGQLIKLLEDNPEHIYIIDGPASGHGITLLNAIYKFREIFGAGLLFQDCQRLITFLEQPNLFKINLVTLPQGLVTNETLETIKLINEIFAFPIEIVMNQSLINLQNTHNSSFLEEYKKRENSSLELISKFSKTLIPLKPKNDFFQVIESISKEDLREML